MTPRDIHPSGGPPTGGPPTGDPAADPAPRVAGRLVLLGASNLTPALGRVAALARRGWVAGPLELLAAAGHGRAYAAWSRCGLRDLPPLAGAALWPVLAARALPTRALVTDLGNDLVYGVTPGETLAAVERCLERLAAAGADTVLTLPPAAAVAGLERWRFLLYRSLMFPGRRFDQATIARRLERLAAGLRRLAEAHGARLAEIDLRWLRSDAIHLRRRARPAAWATICGQWPGAGGAGGAARPVRWSFLAAERSRLLGRPLRRGQPASRLADGSTVSFY